ncbi:hypothetical protein D878_gp34 [Sulfolobales Mexican rudivirus 1]|uniref:Ribbon-helix-helix protein CopG domain-containing protein n=1 Tax=Sulfolobales Mexican rod-shaped virus 1 TaxID=2848122 RepID=K4NX90_9VIRU|nr:hypothetical protein D878_gp34 [Sulfolobales Mexican rudivirus 1]AFV51261.1 hypothetical protein [Sulfolobales Mexican rod-shaped virus 1]
MASHFIITSVRFDNSEYLMLQTLAQQLGKSNSQIIREALRFYYRYVRTQAKIEV